MSLAVCVLDRDRVNGEGDVRSIASVTQSASVREDTSYLEAGKGSSGMDGQIMF